MSSATSSTTHSSQSHTPITLGLFSVPPDLNPDDSTALRAVLDTLVQTTVSFSNSALPEAERTFFINELERLVGDENIGLADKIDGVTELADMCLGRGWESGTDVDLGEEMATMDFEVKEERDGELVVEGEVVVEDGGEGGMEEWPGGEKPRKRTRLER